MCGGSHSRCALNDDHRGQRARSKFESSHLVSSRALIVDGARVMRTGRRWCPAVGTQVELEDRSRSSTVQEDLMVEDLDVLVVAAKAENAWDRDAR